MPKRKLSDSDEETDMNIAKKLNSGFLNQLSTPLKPLSRSVLDSRIKKTLQTQIPKKMHLSSLIPFPTGHNFVSPSSLFHFVKQDPFQDVLNRFSWYFIKKFNNNIPLTHDPTSQFIMDKGNEFELQVKEIFHNAFGMKIMEIPKQGDDIQDSVLYEMTVQAMEKGYDIIYQACVFNPDMGVYGHPDFLIRSDKISQLNSLTQYPDIYVNKSSRFGNFHYVVFDTKFRTLELNSVMEKMINNDAQRYYKVQLYIYSKCLEYIQACTPANAYIIGRGFRSEKTVNKQTITTYSNNIFEMFGTVDIQNIETETVNPNQLNTRELVEAGVEWITTLRSINKSVLENVNWGNPDEAYFRPNMQNKYTSNRDICNMFDIKFQIAVMQGEPTLLSHIGSKERALLHEKGIYSMFDDRCTASIMGYRNPVVKHNLDLRLMQFRDKQGIIPDITLRHVSSQKLDNQTIGNRDLIQKLKNQGYFVLDFETRVSVSDRFDNLPNSDTNACAYLIGLIDNTGKDSVFIPFITNDLSDTSELFNLKTFIEYMKPYYQYGSGPSILTWSKAENKFISNLARKYNDILSEEDKFIIETINHHTVDMCEFFEKENIMIRGCYTLSLKDVAKRLFEMGIIKTTWTADMGGLVSLSTIDRINDEAEAANIIISEHPDFQSMLEYNRIDCQVIVEIVDWLATKTKSYSLKC